MKKKVIALVLVCVLVFGVAVTGTLAWLADKTTTVTNTFTYGDINIELDESDELDLKMIPGKVIAKDPVVTVNANSEACWLFVKITEDNEAGTFLEYSVDSSEGWKKYSSENGVYYIENVSASNVAQEFHVLTGDIVTVKDTITKTQLNAINSENKPALSFIAYAVQKEGLATVEEAWAAAQRDAA